MREDLHAGFACVALVLALAFLGSRPAEACMDCLQAGAASVVLRVPPGTPLAGYGSAARRLFLPDILGRHPHAFWFKPHAGQLDQLVTRALVLQKGPVRVVVVTLDVVAVDRSFTDVVRRRLAESGAADGTLVLAASHTHSGPGAFIDSALMGFIAVDRHDAAVRDALIRTVVDAAQQADAARRPARLAAASVTAPPVTTGRLGRPVDPELTVLKVSGETGSPIALVWNYAIHGTMFGARNDRLSNDVMGLASQKVEDDLAVPVLFLNGAVADVSPRRHGRDGAVTTSRDLADSVRKAWDIAEPSRSATLGVRRRVVTLGRPHMSLRNCLGSWTPRWMILPLGGSFPSDAELIGIDLGPVGLVAVPAELQSALGQLIKQSTAQHWRHVMIAGLANEYLGYFVTKQDYDRSSYVTCANLYGPTAGDNLAGAAVDLLRDMAAQHPGQSIGR